jgi:hypothetical protein
MTLAKSRHAARGVAPSPWRFAGPMRLANLALRGPMRLAIGIGFGLRCSWVCAELARMERRPTPQERLERMQKSFDENYGVLAEDYEVLHRRGVTPGAPNRRSKARRTSARPSAPKSQARS